MNNKALHTDVAKKHKLQIKRIKSSTYKSTWLCPLIIQRSNKHRSNVLIVQLYYTKNEANPICFNNLISLQILMSVRSISQGVLIIARIPLVGLFVPATVDMCLLKIRCLAMVSCQTNNRMAEQFVNING